MQTTNGIELWNKAKSIIPGGSQLLSKQSEQFLPEQWPSFYERANGVTVWDLDGNALTDMSLMGVGTCILGYADEDVNAAVIESVKKGSMTTLNCPEEVELAEILLELNPWADMVRYARTGGEAMAIAVRIARAYSKKDTVAFSGYHGFHDWYLAANLARQDSLDGHLLLGLEPNGVPRALKGTSIPFNHNCIDELEAITNKHEIGAIVLEPVRHRKPKEDFLPRVRAIADEIEAVLIFDEITSGWRMNTGGIHALFGVFPDVAVYGKAMSNGFPMAAVVGRREVMDAAQSSFISSTYWTERIGPTAALATIDKLRSKNVVPHLSDIGKAIGAGWKKSAKKHGLVIDVLDFVPPLITFSFEHDNGQALHTLFTQEMLNRGYLASKSVYVSYAHTKNHVKQYLAHVDVAFETIKMGIEADTVFDLLKGPVAHTGFKRLI